MGHAKVLRQLDRSPLADRFLLHVAIGLAIGRHTLAKLGIPLFDGKLAGPRTETGHRTPLLFDYIAHLFYTFMADLQIERSGASWPPISTFLVKCFSLCRVLRHLRDLCESTRIPHGDVGHDLAVQLHPGLLQAVDEAAVGKAILP